MQLRESIKKTKNFFQKTIKNLTSFFCGGYQKLAKPPLFNPFCCSSGNPKNHLTDRFYTDFYNDWESDLEKAKNKKKNGVIASKEPMQEEDACSGSFMKFAQQSPVKNKQEERRKEGKNRKSLDLGKREEQCSKRMNGGGQVLAQKMKELEMMDVGDVEHVLDIEEALHYYSRLKSPVYLDIVDKFFTDMYTDVSVPQASVSINNSKRRFGSMRL